MGEFSGFALVPEQGVVPEQGIDMIKILCAMYESAKTGKEVLL